MVTLAAVFLAVVVFVLTGGILMLLRGLGATRLRRPSGGYEGGVPTPSSSIEGVCDEQRRDWCKGRLTPAEAFLERYPALRDHPDQVLGLVYGEIELRRQRGQTPRREQFQQRFPELAAKLSQLFEIDDAINSELGLGKAHPPGGTGTTGPEIPGGNGVAHGPGPGVGEGKTPGLPRVKGFEALEEVGRGGMGVVYKARQQDPNRTVALKMIHAGFRTDSVSVKRFKQESQTLAQLHHPNIVQVYAVGEAEGVPFFTMEWVEGGTLAEKWKRDRPKPRDVALCVEALAGAVQQAHDRSIVHRDLKPANVVLTVDGVPKLTDFGLAKWFEAGPGETQSGAVCGTPSYMAPEQAAGRTHCIGTWTDVYGLGAILYEGLTGRPPFQGDTPQEVLKQVADDEPVPPRRFNRTVPAGLQAICLKALAKEPGRRYLSAQDLKDDLERWLYTGKPRVRPETKASKLRKWARRKPAVACLSLLLVLSNFVALVALTMWWREAVKTAQEVSRQNDYNQYLALRTVWKGLVRLAESDNEMVVRNHLMVIDEYLKEAYDDRHLYVDAMSKANQALLRCVGAYRHRLGLRYLPPQDRIHKVRAYTNARRAAMKILGTLPPESKEAKEIGAMIRDHLPDPSRLADALPVRPH